jgi:hypothetical protein
MVVEALSVPEVPVIVTVLLPAVAELLAVKVIPLLPVAGLVLKVAVTPLGRPESARVTEPENGLTSAIEMVSVPLAPWAIDSAAAEGASEKLPVPPPDDEPFTEQANPSSENAAGRAFVAPTFAVKPMSTRAPVARAPL